MNWGRKQKKTSASSMLGRGTSSLAKMFPISWISRLRQWNGNEPERRSEARKISGRNVKRNTWLHDEENQCGKVEKFYGEADENFWRLSFSDEGRKSMGGCPESYNWLDETEFSPSASTCRSCGAKGVSKVVKKESKSIDFNDMLLDMRKTRDSNPQVHAKTRTDKELSREPTKSKVSRGDGKLKNLDLHQLSHGLNRDTLNLAVKDIAEVEAVNVKPIQASTHSKLQGSERKSMYINKDSLKRRSKSGRSTKVKVYSPRTPSKAELCKIRAIEDLKKARMKMRVKEKEEQEEEAVLESLAVVKRSVNPERDFRNSMLEMILDKGISQPEELEELLACYLILNSDEYHDMIIKVFRQVWFDLNKDRLDPSLRDAQL